MSLSVRALPLLAALLAVLSLSACLMPAALEADTARGRSPRALPTTDRTSVVTWAFWASPWEYEINRRVARAFEREHPKIHVELVSHPWEEYFGWLQSEWDAGRSPDVLFLNYVPVRAAGRMLAPLDARIAASHFDLADFHPTLLGLSRYEGQLYALPRDNDTKVIYYNRDVFDAAGLAYPSADWTWEDLRRAAAALTERDELGQTVRYGFAFETNHWWRLWVWQNGGDLVDDPLQPHRYQLDDPAAVEALQFLASLIAEDRSALPPERATSEEITRLFRDGALAMAFGGHGKVPALAEAPELNWDVAPLPRGRFAANVAGGASYAMSLLAPDPDSAWELLSYLAGPKGQALFAESGLITPARRSVREDNIFLRRQPYNPRAFLDGIQVGRANLHAAHGDELNALLDRALQPVWRGEQSAADAVAAARPAAEQLLGAGDQ